MDAPCSIPHGCLTLDSCWGCEFGKVSHREEEVKRWIDTKACQEFFTLRAIKSNDFCLRFN